ncbi:MAG: AarF/UbiB family protein [Gemmatimonadetes bacterium]|nr:AarF/UbiB family protein [Gemmatimonadota bacterium]
MKRWRRGLVIIAQLTPFILAFLRDRRRWLLFGRPARRSATHHVQRAERFTLTIARLGPTFIKLAQVFGARADILPEPYLSRVSQLQDRVPPDPFEEIERVIVGELGRPPTELFDSFETEPVAAASLGQVHRATLGDDLLAVKVLRPGVEQLVGVDLEISFRILFVLNVLFRNHHVRALTNVIREFGVRVREEMDFRQEAANMARFHAHFAEDPRVRAPVAREEFTRRRVLVMEWIEGDRVDRLDARFENGDLDRRTLMETLIECYLRMMLIDGFLHADPHPGNILVAADGTIIFLDWGMVVQLDRSARDAILRTALATGRNDLDGMINGMYALGMIDPNISRSEIRDAAVEILSIVERVRELGIQRAQRLVQEVMDTFYTWPLILPRELVYFFRAAVLLEGIGLRHDPGFDGLAAVRPVIRRMRGDLIAATARAPREIALGVMDEVRTGFAAIREVIARAEREEFRVRIHPRDLLHAERFLMLQVRRVLLSLFAVTTAVIASITFIALRNLWLLGIGLVVALVMFVVVLFLPTHLLENPVRHARAIRPEG